MKNSILLLSLALFSFATAAPHIPEIIIQAPAQHAARVFKVPAPSGGDDWPVVQATLQQALAAGQGAKVVFAPGSYDFSAHKFIDGIWHLNLREASDLIIDGAGATLNMHPSNSFLSLYGCERVVVKNFTLNYTMPHHMQGDIIEVADDFSTLLVKPHSGFPYAADFPTDEKAPKLDPIIFIIDQNTKEMKRLEIMGENHLRTSFEFIADKNLIRYTIDPHYAKRIKRIDVGDIVATHAYYNGHKENMLVRRSSDCVLENITAYSGADMNIRPCNNEGPLAFREIINKPRPDSNNLVATIRDGIHCRSNRGPILIEECTFEKLMDDSINIFSVGFACDKRMDDGGLHVVSAANGEPWDFFRPGDKVALLDRSSGSYLAELTVKKAVPQFKDRKAEVNKIFTLYFEEALPEGILYGPANGQRATEVYNLNACGAGSIVRRNTFLPQRRHALLFSAPNVAFVDNVVDGIQGSAAYGSTQGAYICGPIPMGAIIRNNTIRNTGWQAVKLYSHGTKVKPDLNTTPARDFDISGNTIEYSYADAIALINAKDVVIQNNKLISGNPDKLPIKLVNCIDVQQSGNQISVK